MNDAAQEKHATNGMERSWIGNQEGLLRLWDSRADKLQHVVSAHAKAVTWLDYATEAKIAVTCGVDGMIRFWKRMADSQA